MLKKLQLTRHTIVVLPVVILFVSLFFVYEHVVNASSSFPPNGMAGAPADGMNCSACHACTVQTLTSGITTDIPTAGYVPGIQYNITIGSGIVQTGKTSYGFQMTAQNNSGTLLGTFTAGAGSSVNGKYISQSSAQVSNTPQWQFKWTAPKAGTGTVNFYTAINAANGNKNDQGDQILTSVISVKEVVATSVQEITNQQLDFNAFIIAKDLNLSFNCKELSVFYLQVLDVNGKMVLAQHVNGNVGENKVVVDLNQDLSPGMYVVKLSDFKQHFQRKIVKQ